MLFGRGKTLQAMQWALLFSTATAIIVVDGADATAAATATVGVRVYRGVVDKRSQSFGDNEFRRDDTFAPTSARPTSLFGKGRKRRRRECYSSSWYSTHQPIQPLLIRGGGLGTESHDTIDDIQKRHDLKTKTLNALHQTSFLMVASSSMVVFSPLPSLTRHLAENNNIEASAASSPQAQAVQILSLLSSLGATVELFLSPSIGSLIDKFGRKLPHILLNSLILLGNLCVVLKPGVKSICISRMVNVVVGGFLVIVANAIVADMFSSSNNSGEQMGSVLAKQGASISLGFLLGSLAGGRLTERGERVPYIAALALSVLGVANVVLRMGDSLELSRAGGDSVNVQKVKVSKESKKQQPSWNDTLPQKFMETPLSSIKLLFHYGSHMRTLAILLLLQSAPTFMGDVFQMFAREEWGWNPKDFANIVAIFGILGIVSNISVPLVLRHLGLRLFSLFAIFSSLLFPITTLLTSSSRYVLVAGCLGLFGSAQKVGTSAAMTSLANELGVPQGRLQGEKASMLALLKVVCPVIYSELYLRGKAWSSGSDGSGVGGLDMVRKLPFVLNVILGVIAFAVTWQNL